MSSDKQEDIPPIPEKHITHQSSPSEPSRMSSSTPKISTTRLPTLEASGPDSNFLNWGKVIQRVLKSAKVHHTLTLVDAKLRPAAWEEDNDLVCAVLVQIVDKGGRVFWIRKLVNAQMEGDDINSHIDALAKFHERLNSLVTLEDPLTPDDVHNAALLSSIPPDWIHCVSNLMNQEGVKTNTIFKALCNEAIRQESQGDIISVSSTKPKPVKSNPSSSKTKAPEAETPKKSRRCLLCNSNTHDLNACNNTRNHILKHKAAQKARWEASQQNTPTTSTKTPARAGQTSAATLGNYTEIEAANDKSDYLGSDVGVTAKNAIVSLSTPSDARASGDSNLDSGCSMSMTPHLSSVLHPKPNNTPVHLANNLTLESSHKGTICLPIDGDTSITTLVVPSLHEPLLSIANLCNKDLTVVFTKSSCDIFKTHDTQVTGTLAAGYCRGNLYYLPSHLVSQCSSILATPTESDNSLFGYHVRFSHIGLKALNLLLKSHNIIPSTQNDINVQKCSICIQTKMHRQPFRSRALYRSTSPGQLIHSDMASYEVTSCKGYHYFITFVDDHLKFLTIYPMKNKSDSFSCFKLFRAAFEKSGSHPIQSLRTNNGGKYLSKEFTSYLSTAGIKHDPGPPHSPQLNGVAKRTNRTIHNFVCSALLTSQLPKSFWADAIRHSLFPYNSFPCHTPAGFKSPNSILHLQPLNLSQIRPFGCLAWYKIPEPD
ncbi:hypothetical protein PCANC_01672 [Puccinia coronata f. sp. avenae]|uniref:Integrase catalytic domain-containing protein n=1 Tax=Puccinia coronata f. sp. avenae TaxID=200324 RepID=A0A2N5W3I0_9BASI|nr:hypothetical protein PCANC_01672 [Puccinia coronata f. sp. avenae]